MATKKQTRRKRRRFTAEFKTDVVRLCQSEDLGEVCQRMELTPSSVRGWVKQAKIDSGAGDANSLTTEEREEMRRLKRELKRVTMERDILKKATAFFAKESS